MILWLSTLSNKSLMQLAMKYFSWISCKLGQYSKMCLTVSGSLAQILQVGRSSPDDKYERVMRQWPIHSLLIMTESRQEILFLRMTVPTVADGMKFVTLTAVLYILPLGQTELKDTRDKFMCWQFRSCNWQRKSRFCRKVIFSPFYVEDVQTDRWNKPTVALWWTCQAQTFRPRWTVEYIVQWSPQMNLAWSVLSDHLDIAHWNLTMSTCQQNTHHCSM